MDVSGKMKNFAIIDHSQSVATNEKPHERLTAIKLSKSRHMSPVSSDKYVSSV